MRKNTKFTIGDIVVKSEENVDEMRNQLESNECSNSTSMILSSFHLQNAPIMITFCSSLGWFTYSDFVGGHKG